LTFILECENLKKYFGEVHAVDGADLQLRREETTSIVGPNGAGKTTLINLITGWLTPDTGKVIFDGRDITHRSPHDRVKLGVTRSFQLVNLCDGLSVLDNIRVAILARRRLAGIFFSLVDRYGYVSDEAFQLLKQLGLEDHANELATTLPHGDKKLLDVGLALATQPKLLLLDEPTSGVSTREKSGVMDIIVSVVRDRKVTTLMIEHDVDLAFSYGTNVIVMSQGTVIATGKPGEVRKIPEVVALGYGE